MTIENKRRKVYCYGNGMYVGLKQPSKKINKDGTTQGYYYGNGFYGPDEGDKFKNNLKSIDYGSGNVKPAMWGYKTPSKSKKRK